MRNSNINKVLEILKKNYRRVRKTTLNRMMRKEDPYKILISCIISLRTRDETTEKIAKKLFSYVKGPEDVLKMPLKKLEKIIYSSGYYKNKAKTIKHISRIIVEKYGGKVPSTEKELLKIKGIGRKTANVVLGFAFGKKVIPVDTNVHRIANRLGWVKTKTPEETEKKLEKIVPKKYWRDINGLFILHGKKVCKPVSPLCSECLIAKFCSKIGVSRFR